MNQYFKGWKQLNNEAVIAGVEKEEMENPSEGSVWHPQYKQEGDMPDNINF